MLLDGEMVAMAVKHILCGGGPYGTERGWSSGESESSVPGS
jgi:hypothetical protein